MALSTEEVINAIVDDPSKKKSDESAAVAKGAPADARDAAPITYEVEIDGEKRRLTPNQIAGTMTRYSSLNEMHGQAKPLLDMAVAISKQTGEPMSKVAAVLADMVKNNGQKSQPAPKDDQGISDDEMTKWEQDNASTLPPGYKNLVSKLQQSAHGNTRIEAMLGELLARTKGVADGAAAVHADARAQRIEAAKGTIMNNLAAAQRQFNLPASDEEPFLAFATDRGYSREDFLNPSLTMSVVQDFVNAKNGPEYERLKKMAERRQAYTTTVGSQPSDGAPAKPETPLDRIYQAEVSRPTRRG